MAILLITAVCVMACTLDYKAKGTYLLLVIEMFVMMAFCINNVDQEAYIYIYDSINTLADIGITDVGFGFLMLLAGKIGLGYQGFLIAYTAIGLLLLVYIAKKYSSMPGVVIAVYFVINFATITIQVRSFVPESLQLLAMLYLVYKEKPSIVKYFSIIVVATLFHNVSLFFFLLAVIIITNDRKVISAFTAAVTVGIPAIAIALRYMPNFIVRDKLEQYFVLSKKINITAVAFVGMYIILVMMLLYIEKKETVANGVDSKWAVALHRLNNIHIIGLISCCLIIAFTPNYYRITRVIIMLDYFVIGDWAYERFLKSEKRIAYVAIAVTALFVIIELVTNTWTNIATNNAILCNLT